MKQTPIINDLTAGNVTRQLIIFSIPIMLSNLLQTGYIMADMVIVGQFVGKAGLSAVSIGGDLVTLLTMLVIGFSSAGQVLISQYLGANDKASVKRIIGTMFTFILSCSVVLSIVCSILVKPMLSALNTPAESFGHALNFSLTCFGGLFFIYGYNIVSAILRGMGNSKSPFIFITIAAVTNIVLELIFVAVFHWGTFGAALANVTGQGLSFILSIIYLYRRREAFGFDFRLKSFKIDGDKFSRLMRLGVPMCLQFAAITLSMIFVNSYLNAYGVVASAVSGIGSKLGAIASIVSSALGTAGAAMIGQSLGAGKQDRVKKVIGISLLIGSAFSIILSLITAVFPNAIFGAFSSDPEVLEMSMTFIPCAILLYIGFALRAPFFSLINGIGHAGLNMITGLMDGVVCRIGLALLMGITLNMGIRGFWYGNAFAGFVPFFIGAGYFLSGKWKTHKLLIR